MYDSLIISGVREHNLRDVHLEFPRDVMIVFTGLSGSGKSSLAFDTIFAEGQRHYVESLFSYVRQFFGQMDKSDVDFIEGLSPAVSIDQKSTSRNPRSTVDTIIEIHDYLCLLFARAGTAHYPSCGAEIQIQTLQQIVDRVRAMDEGTRFQVLSPVVRGRKGGYQDLIEELRTSGLTRAIIDGEVLCLENAPVSEKKLRHTIEVVVDRLVIREGMRQRLTDSVEAALRLSEGLVIIDAVGLPGDDPERRRRYSEKRSCPDDHVLALEEIESRTFSFNTPYGAYPECTGLGTRLEVDPDLVVPDEELSLSEGAVIVWNSNFSYHRRLLGSFAKELDFSMKTPWKDLSDEVRDAVLFGKDYEVQVKFRSRWGREHSCTTGFEGVVNSIERKLSEVEPESASEKLEVYMREIPCPICRGTRLRPEVLVATAGGPSIAELSDLSIIDVRKHLEHLELDQRSQAISALILQEIRARLDSLVDVGLTYLTFSRTAGTLLGGEAQRIRLTTQIGSGLVGVLCVLDEPSIGLHQRDNRKLVDTPKRLRDLGNTLIVAEHDEETMEAADWIADIGPEAGETDGWVVHSGTLKGLKKNTRSITDDYLSGREAIPVPKQRRIVDSKRILTVKGVREHNLSGVTADFPLSCFVAVTGVSGSGKSILVSSILYRPLASRLSGAWFVPGRHRSVAGTEHLDKVVHVDQSSIGRIPCSNPATYTGVWDQIRKLFTETPEAKVRGYGPGRFSFNVKGERCEACRGDETLRIEMNFLPDVYVPCEVCHGVYYNRETLEVLYKGKSVVGALSMPVAEAAEFFAPITRAACHLNALVEVGLGYVRPGQSATTLSGGEAQRIRLTSELHRCSTRRTVYVLDEPTTSLHSEDVRKLLLVLQSLIDKGNTVIVIEHNLDVIKLADWPIDMGPEDRAGGGRVVAEGTPEQVVEIEGSYTGLFLKDVLVKDRAAHEPAAVKKSSKKKHVGATKKEK